MAIEQAKESIGILVRTGSNAQAVMDSDSVALRLYMIKSYML